MHMLLALVLACLASTSWATDAPPVEAFFSRAKLSQAKLSPSGRWLAIRATAGTGRETLAVVDSEGKQTPVVIATFSNADVRSFSWVNDERLVFSVIDLNVEMMRQTFGGGLYSIKRDGTEQRQLVYSRSLQSESNSAAGRHPLEATHQLLFVPDDGGDTVIVGEFIYNLLDDLDTVVIKRLNVVDGGVTTLSVGQPPHAVGWEFDPRGEPRILRAEKDGQERLFWRAPGSSTWTVIATYPTLAAPFKPAFVDSNDRLYVSVPEGSAGTEVIKRFDFAAGRPEAEPLIRTPGFDFSGEFVVDPSDGGRLHGIRTDTDAESTVWFDPRMKQVQGIIDQKLPGRINHLNCRHCTDPDIVLVHSWSDQDPGSFWIYRPKTDTLNAIGAARPAIDPATMGTLDLHRIKARDGRDLPVWVTTPVGKPPVGGRPAIALVHGGPFVRIGEWEWDPDRQFLASRGYVVIEPEFRGSTGYGTAHERAGWKHWGDTMQDDVADAVDWVAAQGAIDPHRVCIAGASYGGYSTLMSLIRFPDKYRCGVAWAAVTDPRLMFDASWESDLPEEWRQYGLPQILGDPVKDAAMLHAFSPADRASEIRVPVLLAFGRDDRRVPLEHGTKMRDAMRAAGQSPEWIVYDGEGHGWLKSENTYDFWRRVDAFLAKQLK